jgi:hypothetical protein
VEKVTTEGDSMAALIYDQPREIDRRLAQYFNSTRDQWIEIVKAMVAGRGSCTSNNSKSAPGYYAWDYGIQRMRQMFGREGWINGYENGVETIENYDLKKKITVMSTDEGTADKSRSPRNRTPKGAANEKIVDLNGQFEMFKGHEVSEQPDHLPTWYLCTYDDGNTVRAELSRPTKFISNHFVKFEERIFIIQGDDWEKIAISAPAPDFGSDYQIDVRRK